MSKTSVKTTVEWNTINWKQLERRVYKIQKRIYQASARGDVKVVRGLQKVLMKSWSAKILATRRVTQDNQGKKTAGVDGVKALSPKERLELVEELKLGSKPKPTRRVWIDKPGRDEKRPLGIPTMYDRALQALVKLALEPEWEAKFEPNSYGFRPGRSCHDAIQAILNAIRYKPKFVLDADIAKCFDKINHQALLKKLNTYPKLRRQIKAWLKAGVIDSRVLFPTEEGTPQGGVISPLLANVALHGMEEILKEYASQLPGKGAKRDKARAISIIRYADDFVILHENLAVIEQCREILVTWLNEMGLELKPSKTRLAHTLYEHQTEEPGFDFLGFNVRQYSVGKYNSGLNTYKEILGFKTIITPSKKSVKNHYEKISSTIKGNLATPQLGLISNLNSIIRGWCNYYSSVVSKEVFSKIFSQVYQRLYRWAKRRHPNKTEKWIANKYWHTIGGNNWEFAVKMDDKFIKLYRHPETPIVRHVKVKGNASPFDGDWVYWSSRITNHPEANKRVATLLKKQKGKCPECGHYFRDGDVMEVDHILPLSKGGKDEYKNLQLLHRHCHDKKTASDGSLVGIHDKNHIIEEPYEAKVSRTVL
ncbi:group II intron reverse transcriptase/maturase [Anabaenopsis arnoldii]|uniref:Group II intron reverse transcriptase/maturase n=1 Tax=Anabaenopsis arnoldii TaxID=2152938 RepID=A0ABT5AWC4_9CYAN|nr:group II intron reverse transcriptase/maturase [Anabaenopsis arnoldii]MDB9540997.1 group II intron reverse transcriptase/maturase [Anabaenopsis arnoldii]MDH6093435.1 group II intron reverse transcriptase/maturase [Anabaenopsis arnoldii]